MHQKKIVYAGKKLQEAKKTLIMLHGRGANAEDILSLASYLKVDDFALLAPQATNNTWYPYSFMAPPFQNEPWLSSALDLVRGMVSDINKAGIITRNIYLLGFSQGACLTAEFAARNPTEYGGILLFTGGLVGDRIYTENYKGDFDATPIFLGSSNPDPHIPVERVYATAHILEGMHASVNTKLYDNMGHTINQDEINLANKIVFQRTTEHKTS